MNKSFLKRISPIILLLAFGNLYGQRASLFIDFEDSLVKNSEVLIHKDILNYEIESIEKATEYRYKLITILNPRAKWYGYEYIYYDKLTELTSFSAKVFDASGKEIKKFKKGDLLDQSNISGFSLFEDDRVKILDPNQKIYPYSIEMEYVITTEQTFHIPNWIVQKDEKEYVKYSEYSITAPNELLPNYYLFNSSEPELVNEGLTSTLIWKYSDVTPFKYEPLNSDLENYTPIVRLVPKSFSYSGNVGSLESWESFGKWISNLNKGRDDLSDETKQKIINLTKDLQTKEEKIEAVYNFLQGKTRYVSIQLGIGGYQPFKASVVDEAGYGDCKALSNYTKSLLKAIDIDSYYVLVNAGSKAKDVDGKMPFNRFNHAILAVPSKNDTIWLECTSQTNPFGYLGSFTGNRNVLLIDRDKSKIVRTPAYSAEQNSKNVAAAINIYSDGSAKGVIESSYTGILSEYRHIDVTTRDSKENQVKWLYQNIGFPPFELGSFKLEYRAAKIPVVQLTMETRFKKLTSISGKRLFLKPATLSAKIDVPKKVDNRRTPFNIRYSYIDNDSIEFVTPELYSLEYLPENIKIKNKFGEYTLSIAFENNKCIFMRRLKINSGSYEASDYSEYVDFLKTIWKGDLSKLVLINKT